MKKWIGIALAFYLSTSAFATEEIAYLAGELPPSATTEKALSKTANNKGQSMALMAERADKWISRITGVAKKDSNGVVVAKMQNMPKLTLIMPDHTGLGRLSFKQVGNMDTYYGEWENVAGSNTKEKMLVFIT